MVEYPIFRKKNLHFFCLSYIKNVKPKKIEEKYDLKILKLLELEEQEYKK